MDFNSDISYKSNGHRNPSRLDCENVIKRILVTEVLTKGRNEQFKTAHDFMSYFESLYPASDALTKQVQRAIKSLNLPKDDNGYLIVNKTEEQLEEEKDLSMFLKRSNASIVDLSECDTVFLKCEPDDCEYLLSLVRKCLTLKDKYVTCISTSHGLLFYTKQKHQFQVLLDSLLNY